MNNDTEKIEQIEKILQAADTTRSFELVSLALAIQDEEDRDLYLSDVVRWLVKNETWQKAYGAAQLMSDSYEKSQALQTIGDYLSSIGHLEKAFSVFDEAEKIAVSENLAQWQQAELLHGIAKSFREMKAFYKADEVWEKAVAVAQKGQESPSLQDSLDASSVLAEIAENFAAQERIEKALNVAQIIKNVDRKEGVLLQISAYSQQIKRVA